MTLCHVITICEIWYFQLLFNPLLYIAYIVAMIHEFNITEKSKYYILLKVVIDDTTKERELYINNVSLQIIY